MGSSSRASERYVSTTVDGQAVILILDVRARNVNTSRLANIECIRIMSSPSVASSVVHGDVCDLEIGSAVDAHELDGGILHVQTGDSRVLQAVGIEGFRLRLATIGALAIPPLLTTEVDEMIGSTSDGDVAARERDKRAVPL